MAKNAGGRLSKIVSRFFKGVKAPYRLTLTNEETMSEALTFRLTKKSVYILFSTLFVGILLVFTLLVFFTPLKYYLPGAQQDVSRAELIRLNKLSDSLTKLNALREAYIFNLIQVAGGHLSTERDTQFLSQHEIAKANAQNLLQIDHASRYDYIKAIRKDSAQNGDLKGKDSLQKK